MKESKDPLGDRMKAHEREFTSRSVDPSFPVYARLDGRGFSRFTRGLGRPFDPRMTEVMVRVTGALVEEFGADVGYTQSDEISLGWLPRVAPSQLPFGGKLQKLCSLVAASCSVRFLDLFRKEVGEPRSLPQFDCRVLSLPSESELRNAFVWRQKDATRNAVGMAAHYEFGHFALTDVSTAARRTMLDEAGTDFERDYPESFRRGTFVVRRVEERALTEDELARIPEAHRPAGPVPRSVLVRSHDYPLTAS